MKKNQPLVIGMTAVIIFIGLIGGFFLFRLSTSPNITDRTIEAATSIYLKQLAAPAINEVKTTTPATDSTVILSKQVQQSIKSFHKLLIASDTRYSTAEIDTKVISQEAIDSNHVVARVQEITELTERNTNARSVYTTLHRLHFSLNRQNRWILQQTEFLEAPGLLPEIEAQKLIAPDSPYRHSY